MTKDPKKFINSVELASSSEMAISYPKCIWRCKIWDLTIISEIHAALGLSQLTRAEKGIKEEKLQKYFLAFQDNLHNWSVWFD